jgi:hypothetical protein
MRKEYEKEKKGNRGVNGIKEIEKGCRMEIRKRRFPLNFNESLPQEYYLSL